MCYECRKEGHYAKDCQQRYAQIHQSVVTAMAGPSRNPKKVNNRAGMTNAGPKDESFLKVSDRKRLIVLDSGASRCLCR